MVRIVIIEGETAAEVAQVFKGLPPEMFKMAAHVEVQGAGDPDEGWINWNGGICPVAPKSAKVDVKLRDGDVHRGVNPHNYVWKHPANHDYDRMDIVAYRVVT